MCEFSNVTPAVRTNPIIQTRKIADLREFVIQIQSLYSSAFLAFKELWGKRLQDKDKAEEPDGGAASD